MTLFTSGDPLILAAAAERRDEGTHVVTNSAGDRGLRAMVRRIAEQRDKGINVVKIHMTIAVAIGVIEVTRGTEADGFNEGVNVAEVDDAIAVAIA